MRPIPAGLRSFPSRSTGALSSPARVYSESRYGRNRFGWSELVAITDGQFQYIRAPHEEIYDLRHDPRESENLSDGDVPKKTRDELRESLTSIAGAAKPLPEGETPADPRDKTVTVEDFRAAVAEANCERPGGDEQQEYDC